MTFFAQFDTWTYLSKFVAVIRGDNIPGHRNFSLRGRTLKMGFFKLSSLSEVDFSLHAIFRFSIAKKLGLETQLWIFYVCCVAPKKDWLGSFSIAFFFFILSDHSLRPWPRKIVSKIEVTCACHAIILIRRSHMGYFLRSSRVHFHFFSWLLRGP